MHNDYLAHYGVKGMKWGVRRYQKKDGSLTPAGKKRQKETDKRLQKAQRVGKKSIKAYQRLTDEHDAKVNKAMSKGDLNAVDELDRKYESKLYNEVYKPLYKAGYNYVNRGYGTNGSKSVLSLQYGKYLTDPQYDRNGMELWVDEYMINNGDMKAYRNTYDD